MKSDLEDIIRQEAPASCCMQLHDKVLFASKPKLVCPPAPKELAIGLGHPVTAQELADAMVLTDKEAADLNLFTIGQSDSENWFQQRYGRITVSNIYRVFTRMHSEVISRSKNTHPHSDGLFTTASQCSHEAWKSYGAACKKEL